ncbi:hypothetical protein HYPSUDRAFT_197486 [Hypholoma sublateritium FD-334 SS-4]|uniref:TEL2-interacting protein 1 n=1 Tax=Hypholoma sublateritium (strain FD-334 SS-4) TaxID=945553 RepID=A0A0D2LLB1_HYPSF|nr:hypothetical protein HYPSUDRAFT_197486 [Hypholoma sublateritium FD-334 SS-4]
MAALSRSTPNESPTSQADFRKLKTVCVPLLGASRLTQASITSTSKLLQELIDVLKHIPSENLTPNLISYVFLPASTILQRNPSTGIPDQVLEKILNVFGLLAESWWWTCDIKIWEQLFMVCGSVIGGIEAKSNGKGKARDDETKQAAMKCLSTLLRPRTSEEALTRFLVPAEAEDRLLELQEHTRNTRFIPIIGQTLDSVMSSASSQYLALQSASLEVTHFLIELYLPDQLIPSVLPGTVSTMTKLCLGMTRGGGWTNGEIVSRAFKVIQVVVVKALGNEVCIEHGIIRRVRDLDDLINDVNGSSQNTSSEDTNPYGTQRTESWLRGTATQVHIAMNSLTPLLSHPTPIALQTLCTFSTILIRSTSLTLPQTQPLLLSFLLSLSLSDYPSVSVLATESLAALLTIPSDEQVPLQNILMTNLGDNLSSLPRLLSTQSDARVAHAAGLINATCQLASYEDPSNKISVIAKGIANLLGPSGGIEKWGWSLLSVMEFVEPSVIITQTSGAQLSLETNPNTPLWIAFPELVFKNISSLETRDSLKRMFHSLGKAAGDSCLFAVDWFISLGCEGSSSTSVAALWCACRLLEGIAGISLFTDRAATISTKRINKRLEKHARALAKTISEIWDRLDPSLTSVDGDTLRAQDDDTMLLVQHQKGLVPLQDTLKITQASTSSSKRFKRISQPVIHRALCLQVIAVTSGIAQNRFISSFIYTLYPILHSVVSTVSFLSTTALATLNFITVSTSYASPANLLLSNFDYVLDSISRRLTRRWLDIDASKVLGVMVRLVGADIVDKAGDVVEECFDRLDEYHGYGVIVDGLIEVLAEVVKVIEMEAEVTAGNNPKSKEKRGIGPQRTSLDDFFAFLPRRFDDPIEGGTTDYGPAPRKAWGPGKPSENHDEDDPDDNRMKVETAHNNELPPTPIQALTMQIISRSINFLTHNSPVIRARILNLLASSVPVLPESALLPSIHPAWPFIINRLGDPETFVVSAAAGLIEALSKNVGDFMFRKVWDDVWPKFRLMLRELEGGEKSSALMRSNKGGIGPESAYTHSHRLYRSLLRTMTFSLKGVHEHEPSYWEVLVSFRRFLAGHVHEELQQCAADLYIQAAEINPDAVWLALVSTSSLTNPIMSFMMKPEWQIGRNTDIVFENMK